MTTIRISCVVLALAALCAGCSAPPMLPCKSPQELMRAVEYALKRQDTNLFWSLHYWTNVPSASEISHKAAFQQIFFNGDVSMRRTYTHFELRPLPAGAKTEIRRKDGTELKPNLPILGLVSFRGGDIEYGKGPDGCYWLVMMVKVAPTDASKPSEN